MLFVPERRRHDALGGIIPIGVGIFALIQQQVLYQRLAPDPLAVLAGAADRLVRILGTGMDDIDRDTRRIGDHDGAVGRLALDLRRAGIGTRFGASVALGQQFLLQGQHDIAVFGMDKGDGASSRQREKLANISSSLTINAPL